jgi:hypothetical protein
VKCAVENGEIENGKVIEKPNVEDIGGDKDWENHKELIDEAE